MKNIYKYFLAIDLIYGLIGPGMAQSDIVMNEIYSRGTNNDPDWIELFNRSQADVDISGYAIYDDAGQSGSKPKKTMPSGMVVPAQGFLVIVVDDTVASGFGLSSNGEVVWLENSTGMIVDQVEFPALEVDQSFGRLPDGGEWQILNLITRESSNKIIISSAILMNEIYSRGSDQNPDWIELFNNSEAAIDISSYLIYDNLGQSGSKPKKTFPSNAIIPAKGFFVMVVDDTTASGFGLSSQGEEVWLEDANGGVIDYVSFPALESNQSFGRLPDGEEWQVLNLITRGQSNYVWKSSTIVMNEIYSRGVPEDPDWIELFNTSAEEVDISNYRLYDASGQSGFKPKKIIPPGSAVPALGFLVIVVDDTTASGFGLSSNGDEVWLEDNDGYIIDQVTFAALSTDQSYGRLPDGGEWQVLQAITRGSANTAVSIDEGKSSLLSGYFTLDQNYPNPFNPVTNIRYTLTVAGEVDLSIYNPLGQKVTTLVSANQQAGNYELQWDASGFVGGIYLCCLQLSNAMKTPGQNKSQVRKLILLK